MAKKSTLTSLRSEVSERSGGNSLAVKRWSNTRAVSTSGHLKCRPGRISLRATRPRGLLLRQCQQGLRLGPQGEAAETAFFAAGSFVRKKAHSKGIH